MEEEHCYVDELSKGKELGKQFDLALESLFKEILDGVSIRDIEEIIKPLPTLNAEKIKMKFNEYVEEECKNQLNLWIFEDAFMDKLNILANLEASTPPDATPWRPTEDMTPETYFRPQRIQFLEEAIKKVEDRVCHLEILVGSQMEKLSQFASTIEEVTANCVINVEKIETCESQLEKEKREIEAELLARLKAP